MALKPSLSFSSCDNPVLGIMNVDIKIKMTATWSAITVCRIELVVPSQKYCSVTVIIFASQGGVSNILSASGILYSEQ